MFKLRSLLSRDRPIESKANDRKRYSLFSRSGSGSSSLSAMVRNRKSAVLESTTAPIYESPQLPLDGSSITDSSRSVPTSPLSAHTAASFASGEGPSAAIVAPRRRSRTSFNAAPIDHNATYTPDQYLQLGMQYHESGELEKATYCWHLSAETESPLGLFFYGIALRHGWGCKKSPTSAVRHLQKAAECAVYDLQTGIAKSTAIAKSELILAIYELGVSFRHGWGVPKNLVMAAYYFEIAANLGDPDAQNDLAFCYAHGHGVKKDLYKAAMYYRMAARQGQGIVGNSWIWKDKYSVVESDGWQSKARA